LDVVTSPLIPPFIQLYFGFIEMAIGDRRQIKTQR